MAAVGEIFRCELCGNVIRVIEEGGNPEIHCCGQAMTKVEE
jgi:desulfoferrodoxin-like iron-binding protein